MTQAGWDGEEWQRERSSGIGVRTRILGTVLVLAAIGMTFSGTAFTLFERRQVLQYLDTLLLGDVRQLHVDGASGQVVPGGVDLLLRDALKRHVAMDGEVAVAFMDGKVKYVTVDPRPFAPERLPELVEAVRSLPPDAPSALRQIETSAGPVRYIAVQVRSTKENVVGTFVVAVRLQPALDRLASSARLYAVLSGGGLVVIGVGGWLVAGRLLRPLRLLRQAADVTSHTDLRWRIPVHGKDDVSDLTRSVNGMLDRLEDAFDTQQQFLDDAGHELRTPITIVRGNLELMDSRDPRDVEDTRALLIDELDRMGRLVTDLIVLAQSGRPDFVQPGPVDLDRLLRVVFEKTQPLGDRNWVLDATVGHVVDADGDRLTQAMIQLVDNAVKHTQPGDEIGIGGVYSRGLVHLWVRDTGPGVAPEDAERIFERFARASRTRGDGHSSGLGLSIVSSIAAAHGGHVELSSAGQHGARFTLVMPLAPRTVSWADQEWQPLLTGIGGLR